jgi:endonuclease III
VMEATETQLKPDYDWLIRAYLLLRHHGQQLCKQTRPLCQECPIARSCDYGSALTTKTQRH